MLHIHPFTHTFMHHGQRQPCRAPTCSTGAIGVRRLAQGHCDRFFPQEELDSNHRPFGCWAGTLPPEPLPPPNKSRLQGSGSLSQKCVVQNVTQLLLLHPLQSLLCTIIQKPHVIFHRHLTKGTRASEVGLILQRSIVE